MNKNLLFLCIIVFVCLFFNNVALSQVKMDLPSAYKNIKPILIPKQGFGKLDREEFIEFLLKQQMFQGDFQDKFDLKSTLDDFRKNNLSLL